ncbi:hypothetical protein HNQ77_000941 [Silvibacterium bohemicum]|uniref:Zinc-finger domain-containing protein n=1 Tax=Silvibacterium bohemicum TaxID=1577686 RepID=A0A841JR28_9BACT|nr:hypothetical protein [Silvibacterium bohemicum]MBB6142997.1 hypothetical protein [Silvibacterium bohemicum]
MDNDPNQGVQAFAPAHCDDYFIELCALSTTDALTSEQWRQLELHLSICASCREIKAQYDGVIATALPALAVHLAQASDGYTSDSWSIEQAEASLMARIDRENISPEKDPQPSARAFNWRGLPWPYAGAAVFLIVAACAGYRIGLLKGRSSSEIADLPTSHMGNAQRDLNHSGVPPSPAPLMSEQRTKKEVELRQQLQSSGMEVVQLKEQLNRLENELADSNSALDRDSQNHAELERQLSLAQTNAQNLEDKLNATVSQNSQSGAQSQMLQAQVSELTASMREKDQQIAQHEELLDHDRDIRNLIGARDLYIAEIYDVAKNGKTQKPFGRVFYTKGKSLVFYAYDLDQQPGVKLASTFQAWGRKGIDQQHDINLGVFYQDDQNKKRWILKSNDPITLAQIDAVFVTVEPNGESSKPSGKPLLFTYLRLTPNHP